MRGLVGGARRSGPALALVPAGPDAMHHILLIEDDELLREGLMPPQLEKVPSVHARHHEAEQDQAGRKSRMAEQIHGFRSLRRRDHPAAVLLQDLLQQRVKEFS